MEKEDEENQKIHFCLPVCSNDRFHVHVRRLPETRENKITKKNKSNCGITGTFRETSSIWKNW